MNVNQLRGQTAQSAYVPAKADTEYHILRLAEAGDHVDFPTYELVERNVKAQRADAAIRKWAENNAKADKADVSGLYVAVPSRSWKPQTVKTKVETTLVVEDAPS